jgi:hypothetical protein
MKKLMLALSLVVMSATISIAHPPGISIEVIVGTRPPAPGELQLMKAEENRHPNIAKAMHDMEDAIRHLHDAPDDFGGHKGQAEADLKQGYISLRKALYYRLYEDSRR